MSVYPGTRSQCLFSFDLFFVFLMNFNNAGNLTNIEANISFITKKSKYQWHKKMSLIKSPMSTTRVYKLFF